MKLQIEKSFLNDLKKLENNLKEKILKFVKFTEEEKDFGKIFSFYDTKKLKGNDFYYRIRFGDYRLVFKFKDETLTLLNFKHRKEFIKIYN